MPSRSVGSRLLHRANDRGPRRLTRGRTLELTGPYTSAGSETLEQRRLGQLCRLASLQIISRGLASISSCNLSHPQANHQCTLA